jgi:uncharacterized protein (TIRG00374 family)
MTASGAKKPLQTLRAFLRVGKWAITLLLLGLGVNLLLPQLTSVEHMARVVRGMAPWAVVAAIACQVLSYLGSGYLLRSVAALGERRITLGRGVLITLASSSVGMVAGGLLGASAATYQWMKASGADPQAALLGGWVSWLFNNLAVMVIALTGVTVLIILHELALWEAVATTLVLVVLACAVGATLLGMRSRARLTSLILRVGRKASSLAGRPFNPQKILSFLDGLFSALESLRGGGWVWVLLGACANVVFDALTLYFLFIAADYTPSPAVLLTGYGLPQLFGKTSLLPGGVGIVEATMTALYHGFGVPTATVVVVVMCYRAISFWAPTALGFLLIPYFQHLGKGQATPSRECGN